MVECISLTSIFVASCDTCQVSSFGCLRIVFVYKWLAGLSLLFEHNSRMSGSNPICCIGFSIVYPQLMDKLDHFVLQRMTPYACCLSAANKIHKRFSIFWLLICIISWVALTPPLLFCRLEEEFSNLAKVPECNG